MNIHSSENRWATPIFYGACVAALVGFAGLIWLFPTDIWHQIIDSIEGLGPWVGVAIIGLMVLHNVVPIPAEMIAMSAGATCGVLYGIVFIWIGAMIGAALAFWLARRFGRGFLATRKTAPYLARLDRLVASGDWRGLLMVRMIPIVSFNVVNYGAGLTGVGWWTFLWTTAVGILPLTIASVFAGAGLQMVGPFAAIAIVTAAIAGYTLFKWQRRK